MIDVRQCISLLVGFTIMFTPIAMGTQPAPPVPTFIEQLHIDRQIAENTQQEQLKKDLPQLTCMAVTIYGETKGTSDKSQLAVAYVIVNRMKHHYYPDNACDVVLQPGQMDPIKSNKELRTIAKNAKKGIVDQKSVAKYSKYIEMAKQAFYNHSPDPSKGATHFYSPKLVAHLGVDVPDWSRKFTYRTSIDGHKYYRM